jgi:hypothetical protein
LQEGPEIEASLCRGDACVDWVIKCRQTNPNPPLTTAKQWAEYFQVGHLVNDQDLRQIHGWVYEYNSSGQEECVPVESDWMLISDPYITVHWEFVGDPPDLTVPGTYFLKAIFANDSIRPHPQQPCCDQDGTENCEACQECPARKKPTIRDPDVERLFTIWVVEAMIHWPKCPIPVQEGAALSNTFITDNGCHRQSNQAVVIGALGTNLWLAWVVGEISPAAFSPWWEIDEHMGSLYPQDATCPDHMPPDEPGTGNIYLYAEGCEDRVCVESVSIIVFPDHLTRDLANFYPYMRCSPNVPVLTGAAEHFPCTGGTNPGLQLADESCVEGLSLTCGASVSHATIGDHEGWNPVDCFGEQGPYALVDADVNEGAKTWQEFQQMQIQRGDIIQLGYYPAGSSIHQTAGVYSYVSHPEWAARFLESAATL